MTITQDVQLAPLFPRPQMSAETFAALEAKAAQAEAELAARIAREEQTLAESGAVPGSLADRRAVAGLDQEPIGRWEQRHAKLLEQIESGAHPCCGEHERPGYYGFCSLLGRPRYLRASSESVEFGSLGSLERKDICTACPMARKNARIGEWFADLLSEMDAICRGEIDV